MVAARTALLAAALGLTGCGTLIGVEDPVAEFEISPLIDGRYLLTIDAQTSLGVGEVWRFEVSLVIQDRDARVVTMSWAAFAQGTDRRVGSEQVFTDIDLENTPGLDFAIEPFVLVVDDEATAGGAQARITGVLDGRFPILPPLAVASTSSFCGQVSGAFTQPNNGPLSGVTFGALFLEDGAALPAPKASCEALGE